ncbi:Mobile element protein [uncultured Candidatus Thioglobus sp.]|nr:Mobile element protein [uncultured Candidatus Thioglobus sp.]
MITKMNKACKQYNTKELCQLLKLPRSSYYYQIKDKPISNNIHAMIKFIKQTAIEVGHTYGKRRMQVVLNNQGYNVGLYQTTTLMKKANVVALRPRKRHYYPNAGTIHKKAENLLNREFKQQSINTHWVGDITYIKTYQGWSYLASVVDLSSKQVVGWALSKQPNAQLARDALQNAVARHQPNTNALMFHSDQGVQYCANAFAQYCKSKGITQSMSRRGNCWDNAVMERFFRSLKTEKLNYQSFASHQEVVENVESYIYFYNYKRIHSAIGYKTPAEKMAELEKVA